MTKSGVENYYLSAAEALTDLIQKFEIYGACSNTYSNAYNNNKNRNFYPTLKIRQHNYE